MVKNDSKTERTASFLSEELASEFQSVLHDQYGKIMTLSEAQQVGLRIAQFVFLKEARQRTPF